MLYLVIGLTMFFAIIFPLGSIVPYVMQYTGTGMYSGMFRNFPPVVYLSIVLFLSYLAPLIFTLVFIKVTNLRARLPLSNPGSVLLITGSALILLPQLLRLFTSTIPGGGASFSLITMAAPFIILAKILVVAGGVKLLMAVEPSPEYVYEGDG